MKSAVNASRREKSADHDRCQQQRDGPRQRADREQNAADDFGRADRKRKNPGRRQTPVREKIGDLGVLDQLVSACDDEDKAQNRPEGGECNLHGNRPDLFRVR
jgi:hypothetical protein